MQPNGSAISLPPDTSQRATLMSDQLSMFGPQTLPDTPNAISSPASVDGPARCVSPDGMTRDLFGQAPAHVNPSAQPVRARRPMTNATCGLRGFLSSPSAALQSSLESRLRRQLDGVGSTLFSLIWNRKGTPAGRPYFQLVASGRLTSDSDAGSWPTPCVPNGGRMPKDGAMSSTGRTPDGKKRQVDVNWIAKLTSWPTPQTADHWAPSSAESAKREADHHNLQGTVHLACSWATPKAASNSTGSGTMGEGGDNLQTATTIGLTSNGSPAQTEKLGQLNPAFSAWLMGYSEEHLSCAPSATPSSRKSRQSSSNPQDGLDAHRR
jgi:hypothetical protein